MPEVDPTVLTLASIPAILAVVNLIKGFGIDGKWSALIAVLLGVGFMVADVTLSGEVYEAAKAGLLLGLGAAGLYDFAKTTGVGDLATTIVAREIGTVASPLVSDSPDQQSTPTVYNSQPGAATPKSNTLVTSESPITLSD